MLSTSGEFVEVLNFREDNEESSEETTGCKASVYAEFDECTRSENFIEISQIQALCEVYEFHTNRQTGNIFLFNSIEKSQKDACFQNFWKMSVLFVYPKAKEKIKNWQGRRKCVHQRIHESGAGIVLMKLKELRRAA